MRLETKNEGKVLIVRSLENRMDAKVTVDFKTKMSRFIDQGNKLIVLSIAKVDFIDSSGLGAIVSVLKLIGHDGDIAISGAEETVLSMFKLTRMDRVFRMFDTEQEAVESLTS